MRHAITEFWRPPRRRRWLVRGGGAFLLYLVTGFFLVPALVKWQLLKQLPPVTHRLAAVRQVKCNPLALSLTVRGLALTETNGQPFASFEEFYANFQLSTLFRLAWTFDEISLKEPRAEIIRGQDGRFNFANLFAPLTNAAPPKPRPTGGIPRLLVFNLSVTNGHAGFADLSRRTPFRTVYEPINLSLKGFTTKPDGQSPYAFQASSDSGRSIAWAGAVTAQPLGSTGTLRIAGVQLPKHAPYVEDLTRAQLTDGSLDVAGSYSFAAGTNGTDLAASNLEVRVTKLELKDPDTGEVVMAMPSLELHDGTFDWRGRRVRVGSLLVNDPALLVRRRADGSINLPSLAARRITTAQTPNGPTTNNGPAEAPWVFALDDYQLEGGSVQFEDATAPGPFRSVLKPVTLRVQHFSTATNAEAALQAQITTEAAETVNLTATCSVNPPHSTSALKLTGIDLKKYQPYLVPWFRGILAGGKVDVTLESSQVLEGGAAQAVVTNAAVLISGLRIQSADGGEIMVDVPSFAVENGSGNLAEKTVRIGGVKSSGTTINARREADGTINLLSLIASPTNSVAGAHAVAATNTVSASTAAGWRVALDEFALRDWTLHLADGQLPKTGKVELDQLALTLRGARFPSNAPVAIEFSTRVNAAGTIGARGTIWPYSAAVDTEIEVTGLDLPAFQPWVEQQVKLGIQNGTFQTKGRVELTAPGAPGPKLHFTGVLGVSNFALVDRVLFKDFVSWDDLAIKGIDFDLQPNRAVVEAVRFSGLKTSIIIDANKRPNFLAVLPASTTNVPSAAPPPAPTAKAGDSFPIQLGELRLEKTSIHFSDQSVQPACMFDLRQLDGTVKGLSTNPDSTADVDISGRLDEAAPFALRGKMNPLARDLALDLAFTNHNLQLTPFTPYLEKYGGHPLNKGRLSLDLNYTVHGKELKAQNKVHLDQLMLGPRNDSPAATKLPVKLAVALLKDSNGRIDLDLPVEGRLDDPQFSVGPIILKVLVNLIAKAAASPFKLLGALVGGGEELSFVDFDAGKAQLPDSETNKLGKLVQALEKRPALNLEIEGSLDPVADRDALARGLVQDEVKSQHLLELSAIGQALPLATNFQLEPAESERLLRALVLKTFDTNLTAALRALADRAAMATNTAAAVHPPARGPGLFTRVASLFKPGQERAAIRQAHQTAKADALLREQNPELATLTAEDMVRLLGAKTEVPADNLRQLMQDRAKTVQAYLSSFGKVAAERLFLVAPKVTDGAFKGEARVHLALD
jgi:Domain of Unknown Function (DUF748)